MCLLDSLLYLFCFGLWVRYFQCLCSHFSTFLTVHHNVLYSSSCLKIDSMIFTFTTARFAGEAHLHFEFVIILVAE